jgi:ATP phosphoribosyltransferase
VRNKLIKLVLTKGRIEDEAVVILRESGYDVKELIDKGRKLLFKINKADNTSEINEIEVVLAKAADVITYIEHGVCDVGIVGKDTIMEYGKSFYEVLDLNISKCKFSLAGIKGKKFYDGYEHKVIATKYPNVTKKYFMEKGYDVEIVKIDGSVELAPLLGLADGIVDIVSTGATLCENGLEVYEDIAQISTRVIVNKASIKMKKNEIDVFIKTIGKNQF